jgi:hypothetical protein
MPDAFIPDGFGEACFTQDKLDELIDVLIAAVEPDPALPVKISALTSRVAELEAANKRLDAANLRLARKTNETLAKLTECERRQGRRQFMTREQYHKLQFCLHPDRIAPLKDAELTARFTQAFCWLTDNKPSG